MISRGLSWLVLLVATQVHSIPSNVPLLQDKHLAPDYWQAQLVDEAVLMSRQDVQQFNAQLIATSPHVVDPLQLPAQYSGTALSNLIDKISSVPSASRYYPDGTELSATDWQIYLQSLNKNAIQAENPVRFGLVVERSPLRTFPTLDRVLNKGMDSDLDRFQESAVFPGEAVAVLHQSLNGEWLLVQNYHYLAWVQKKAVALGSKQQVSEFVNADEFVVVTGANAVTNYVPGQPAVSAKRLDMGVKLPLLNDSSDQLYGQNPAFSFVVRFPVRDSQGKLTFAPAMIGRGQDVHLGYLPLTRQAIVAQAYKFLGERYGWGHDFNARDCTGFVGEIYKSFGLLMPRNSGQQGKGEYGQNWRFDKNATEQQKLAVIAQLEVGDLIYIPGHVVMYLGQDQQQPFVIHDVKGLAYFDGDEFYRGTLNGVSVTPLLPMHLSEQTRYLDRIYAIKRIVTE